MSIRMLPHLPVPRCISSTGPALSDPSLPVVAVICFPWPCHSVTASLVEKARSGVAGLTKDDSRKEWATEARSPHCQPDSLPKSQLNLVPLLLCYKTNNFTSSFPGTLLLLYHIKELKTGKRYSPIDCPQKLNFSVPQGIPA